jgi:hypothetical protein
MPSIEPSQTSPKPPFPDGFEVAMNHAWSWFALHSAQRMQMINFYILAMAFLTAGYATVAAAGKYSVAVFIAMGGIAVSGLFNAFDARTRELVRGAEPALIRLEQEFGDAGFVQMDCASRTHVGGRRAPSYRVCVNLLTAAGAIAFAAGFVHAVVSL